MEKIDPSLAEKTLSKKMGFDGELLKLEVEVVELPNGKTATREIIRHPGAVAIVCLNEENKIVLVRQFRKPLDKTLLEIPAGKLEYSEDHLECAKRELLEETGYIAKSWKKLGQTVTAPGFTDETIHLFLATDVTSGTAQPDEDEFLQVENVRRKLVGNYIMYYLPDMGEQITYILRIVYGKRNMDAILKKLDI